jgi:hypothetical protein
VLDAIVDAADRMAEAGVAVDWDGPNPFDELDLPEEVKLQLREAVAAGYWRGPPDPPGPYAASGTAAESPAGQQAAQATAPAAEPPAGQQAAQAAAERPPIIRISFPKPPPNRYVGGVPERYWRKLRL